jgi:hypothetical protein
MRIILENTTGKWTNAIQLNKIEYLKTKDLVDIELEYINALKWIQANMNEIKPIPTNK